jgi:hypothetical protein
MPNIDNPDAERRSPSEGLAAAVAPQATALVRDGFARAVRMEAAPGRVLMPDADDPHAQAALRRLVDPERSRVVLRRAKPADGRVRAALEPSDWAAFELAWQARGAACAGARLRLLTGPVTSPTERGLIAALLARRPGARWHVHAPWRDLAAEDGARFAFGRAVTPLLHIDKARCVLALGADPFADAPAPRVPAPDAAVAGPALFAVEATPSRLDARAVDRIALSPARIEDWLWRLAAHWMPEIAAPDMEPDWAAAAPVQAFERRLIDALRAAGDAALIIPGPGLSPETHALALALNQRLGAIGHTLTLIEPPDAAQGVGTLADLVHALQDDAVDTLVVIGANPVHDASAAFGVPLSLSRARLLVHAGTRVDETAAQADWHLPLSQPLELWGDALGADGSAALLQPVIAPPAQARSASELLALLAGDPLRDGWSLLRRQWQPLWSCNAGETLWRDSLRRGVVPASASRPVVPVEARLPTRRALQVHPDAAPALVALFVPAHACLVDDALLLSPATAARLGLATGDRVRARVDASAIEAPVRVLEGQADDVVTLPLGGGRRHGGGSVDFNANSVRPATALSAPITMERIGPRADKRIDAGG